MIPRLTIYCAAAGLCIAVMGKGEQFALSLLSGAAIGAAFIPIARNGPRGFLGQFIAMLSVLLIVGTLCSVLEAVVFLPDARMDVMRLLTRGVGVNLLLATVLATMATAMKLPVLESGDLPTIRGPFGATAMILLCGVLYVIYFLVFGSIALIFVRKYYAHALHPGPWFFPYEIGRGVLMTLALLPIIATLRLPRLRAALAVGVLLWIVGGGAALLLPNPYMVAPQRYIHIAEIMAENVLLGMTAVFLLRRSDTIESTRVAAAVV
jgi:hypothetical protein